MRRSRPDQPAAGRGLTVRVRFTLLYGGMFLLAGSTLIAVTYLLAKSSFPTGNASRILSELDTSSLPKDRSDLIADQVAIRQALAEQRQDALNSLLQQSLIALGLVAALAVGLGWMMAGRVLRPVQRITETARRVADRSLHERIGLRGPRDEFKELADTFDAMLTRLDHSFDSQRRFVANASHELRTPLAINRTLLELTLARSDLPAELRQILTVLIATSDRSERLLDGLLTLARSENEAVVRRPVDLSDLAAHAVEQTAGEASTAGVLVDADPDPAPTTGDPALLERVALNLVQNGIRHNHDGGWVTVHTGAFGPAGWTELVVANTGPVVPAYDVADLFEPFRRLNGERTGGDRGIGLGLSIVRTVVHTHGGDVHAEPRRDGGLVVRVRLPPAETGQPAEARQVSPARGPTGA